MAHLRDKRMRPVFDLEEWTIRYRWSTVTAFRWSGFNRFTKQICTAPDDRRCRPKK
jgi:hypothetical protein